MQCLKFRRFPGRLGSGSLENALKCTAMWTIDSLKAKADGQLAGSLACSIKLFVSTAGHMFHASSSPLMRGFAAESGGEKETSYQDSLRRRPERKVCTGCKEDKPATEFRASRNSRDGLQHFCIPCKVKEAEEQGMAAPATRQVAKGAECTRCKDVKPAAQFYRKSISKTGLQSWCKACMEEAAKQWREKLLELSPDRSADVTYKMCARCQTAKQPEEYTHHKSTRDGLSPYCRQCKEKLRHLSLQRLPGALEPSDSRVCTKCGREVPSSNFYAKRDSVTGLHSWCKDCQKGRDPGVLMSTPAQQGSPISLMTSTDSA